MSAGSTVYDCIVNVARDIAQGGIGKTRRNEQQGYTFRGIEDVMNALSPLLAKHRLVILPRVLARTLVERASRNGGVLFYVTVEAEFDFVSAADGSRHTVKMFGEAMDSADKATNKAMSAAYKYAAVQTFCIPTEGDHDADRTTNDVAPAPAAPTADARDIAARLARLQHPEGYLAWCDVFRAAAMLGPANLEHVWFAAPQEYRQHMTLTAPALKDELKAIAARMVTAPRGNGRAS